MTQTLTDKTAIITGAASGIGRSCAIVMAERGANVVVSDLESSDGDKVVSDIQSAGGEATFIPCDVSDADQIKQLIDRTVETYGELHIGVNNAGVGGSQAPTGEMKLDDWQWVIDVNLTGAFLCMHHQIQAMTKQEVNGSIINISSILGQVGFATSCAYTASKHGLNGLTKAAALEYGPQGIRVNAVGPAFINTPMIAELKEDEATYQGLVDAHPVGRLGEPEEVAHFVAFLASDEASFMTGSYYPVDGGYLAR